MSLPSPSSFCPELTSERLEIIASALLDVYESVHAELTTSLDDGYTRGTTTFGRQKNCLIQLCQSGKYPWLDLRNTSNDLVCAIGNIPFRFFQDDPESPKKRGFWRINVQEQGRLFESEATQPAFFRFIVVPPVLEDDEPTVFFHGFNAQQEQVCEWKSTQRVRLVSPVKPKLPEPEKLPEPNVELQPTKQSVNKTQNSG